MTGHDARFTVITPVLNMRPFIGATIESVLRNLRPGDEYFIIDGGSSDGTEAVIRSYSERITWWVSEPDRGHGDALRKGFARTRTAFQCWLNAGDLFLDGALEQASQCLVATGADFIFGDNFHVDELGRILAFSRGYVPSLRDWMAFAGWTPLQDACFWRRDLYERVGGIDPDLHLAIDYDLFLRFSLEGRCVYVPVAFSAFRRHPEQRSIAMAARYAAEREWSRRRALAAARRSKVDQRIREAAFWVMSRYRDHVLRRAWDLRSLHGIPVMSLPSQPHYGTMTRTPRPAPAPGVRRGPNERLCR